MANNRDFTLKRNNGSSIDTLYPTTRWGQVEEKPTTFTPTAHAHTKSDITDFAHTHQINDITNLQSALNSKENSNNKVTYESEWNGNDDVKFPTMKMIQSRLDNMPVGGSWELLRDRSANVSLTDAGSGTTNKAISVSKTIAKGDTLMVEVSYFSNPSFNPTYIIFTMGDSSTNPTYHDGTTFSKWSGSSLAHYSFAPGFSGTNLYFGKKNHIRGDFSGTTISWTTGTYTLYVGRVWRLRA